MELVSVAAVAGNGVIGRDGELPWESIPADKQQYRERVADAPVILGRRTFESMRGDLPGRAQVVLSRTERSYDAVTARHAGDVAAALKIAASLGRPNAYVLGGAEVYELLQSRVDRMVLSRVHGSHDGDCYYPEWDPDEWECERETPYDRFTLEEWRRVGE